MHIFLVVCNDPFGVFVTLGHHFGEQVHDVFNDFLAFFCVGNQVATKRLCEANHDGGSFGQRDGATRLTERSKSHQSRIPMTLSGSKVKTTRGMCTASNGSHNPSVSHVGIIVSHTKTRQVN